jgi:hypothetical protein
MNYKGYMFIPGNKSRGIGYKIYGLGSNLRWPDGNSVDRLLLVGQRVIDKPSGYDWRWEGEVFSTAEKAVEAAATTDDAGLYLHYDAEEFEAYVRSFANSKTQFEKAEVTCWHPDYGYFFRWWNTPMQGYMTCDHNRLVMWENLSKRVVRYMFRW